MAPRPRLTRLHLSRRRCEQAAGARARAAHAPRTRACAAAARLAAAGARRRARAPAAAGGHDCCAAGELLRPDDSELVLCEVGQHVLPQTGQLGVVRQDLEYRPVCVGGGGAWHGGPRGDAGVRQGRLLRRSDKKYIRRRLGRTIKQHLLEYPEVGMSGCPARLPRPDASRGCHPAAPAARVPGLPVEDVKVCVHVVGADGHVAVAPHGGQRHLRACRPAKGEERGLMWVYGWFEGGWVDEWGA